MAPPLSQGRLKWGCGVILGRSSPLERGDLRGVDISCGNNHSFSHTISTPSNSPCPGGGESQTSSSPVLDSDRGYPLSGGEDPRLVSSCLSSCHLILSELLRRNSSQRQHIPKYRRNKKKSDTSLFLYVSVLYIPQSIILIETSTPAGR